MSDVFDIEYHGGAPFVSALAQMLREEGVEVEYTPPLEQRGVPIGPDINAVAVQMIAVGGLVAIKKAVARFRARFPRNHVSYTPRHTKDD